MTSHTNRAAFAVAIALALFVLGALALAGFGPAPAAAAPAAQVALPRTVTLYEPTAVTTGTTYSSAPLTAQGNDLARTSNYGWGDFFVSTDAGSTGTIVVTVQASADESTWADVTEIVHVADTSLTHTLDVSGTLTGTLTTAGVLSQAYTYQATLSGASASNLIRAPLPGEFVRVKIVATGAVTPTVKATFR